MNIHKHWSYAEVSFRKYAGHGQTSNAADMKSLSQKTEDLISSPQVHQAMAELHDL